MKKTVEALAGRDRRNPAIPKEIVVNSDKDASKFNLGVAEMEAIRNNNFNTVGSAMGAGRSLHAQNHDDGCL